MILKRLLRINLMIVSVKKTQYQKVGVMEIKRSCGFRHIFTVAFLQFLAHARQSHLTNLTYQ